MPFSNARSAATSYLILRHLYDGDIIDWPLSPDHPLRAHFDALEAQGVIARWDRIWPLSDRYRLTEKGIAALEAIYRPTGADAFYESLRAENLPPHQRRARLQAQGLDPVIWPILHDPFTHWSTVGEDPGRYYAYLWDDQKPPMRRPSPKKQAPVVKGPSLKQGGGGGGVRFVRGVVDHHHHHHYHHQPPHHDPTVVDLDQESRDPGYAPPPAGDYDVS
jgi:hypothetical protein